MVEEQTGEFNFEEIKPLFYVSLTVKAGVSVYFCTPKVKCLCMIL
jgi:hypothetical protein